jgi:serine/threonine protein kinase
MNAAAHPTDQTLHSYGLGKLDDEAAEGISRHLDVCPDCVRRIAGLPSDSFLGRLRQAELSDSFITSGTRSTEATRIDGGVSSSASPRAGTLPIELTENPDYEVVRELGGGGMGLVYLAHNRLMGRHEVLKLIDAQIIERPGVRDRFLREIRAVAKLRHPNIVSAYSAFRAGASLVFAMEYVDGLDLARLVMAKGPMPMRHASYFVHQAALGLQHAHQAGMVHRDIKPGNLMLTQKGGKAVIKVLDFGLAKAEREQKALDLVLPEADRRPRDASNLTLAGQFLGTPDFIAPEQIADAQGADILADIYSLGCTLYYVLTGRPPFQAQSLHEILEAHQSMDARRLNFVRPEVPAELAAAAARMMAKDPHRRFQTPGEVAQALVPFFTPRTAASVSPNLGIEPVVGPDPGRSLSEPTPPGHDSTVVSTPSAEWRPGMWSSLIEFGKTEHDVDAVGAEVKPVRVRSRRLWPVVAAWSGFAAVLFAAAAFNPRLHQDRGNTGLSVPGHNIATMLPRVRKPVDPPEAITTAHSPTNAAVRSAPIAKRKVDNPQTDGTSVANGKRDSVPAQAPSANPRRPDNRQDREQDLEAEPEKQIANAEQSSLERLKHLPHILNKSVRWEDSDYILDAEDDVRREAATVARRYKGYLRAISDLEGLKRNDADRIASVHILRQRQADISDEERLLRESIQGLRNMSAAKREERRSLVEYRNSMTSAAISMIDDDIRAIDTENTRCRKRVEEIRRLQQDLNNQLLPLSREIAGHVQINALQISSDARREDYMFSLKALRECVDLVKQLYDDVASDPKVKTTMEAKNQGLLRPRWKLGPSLKLLDVERKLQQHENWVKATSTSRDGRGASKAAPRSLPPAF